ncbi:MAG: hypothetical protein ACJ0NM_01790 [Flavobacteriaceae bacterium]
MRKLIITFAILFTLFVVLGIIFSSEEIKEKTKKSIIEQSEKVPDITKKALKFIEPIKEEIEILNFKSLSEKKVGLRSQNRAIQKILLITLEGNPSKDLMKNTAISIWEQNLHYNEFTILMYLEGMDITASAYCVVEFNKQGITDFIVFN